MSRQDEGKKAKETHLEKCDVEIEMGNKNELGIQFHRCGVQLFH